MTPAAERRTRNEIHLHLLARVVDRRLPLDLRAIVALEESIERLSPAFLRPGRCRYLLRVKVAGIHRLTLVYDARRRCLLTAWWHGRPNHPLKTERNPR